LNCARKNDFLPLKKVFLTFSSGSKARKSHLGKGEEGCGEEDGRWYGESTDFPASGPDK
jgi:hypothetical protein